MKYFGRKTLPGYLFSVAIIIALQCDPTVTAAQERQASIEHAVSAETNHGGNATAGRSLERPEWEIEAGGKLSFGQASVLRSNMSSQPAGQPTSNVPLDPGAAFVPTGGVLQATNTPLFSYIMFAYRLNRAQAQTLQHELPQWAISDKFDIHATGSGNPTKDQLRLMMQALLDEKFGLTMHRELRESPVYVLTQVQTGKLGPNLRAHSDDSSCSAVVHSTEMCSACSLVTPTKPKSVDTTLTCGGVTKLTASTPNLVRVGGRDLSMVFIANSLAGMGRLDRPIVDETSLTGKYDFTFEWEPQGAPATQSATSPMAKSDQTFLGALREQLGLSLRAEIRAVPVVILDHITPLTQN